MAGYTVIDFETTGLSAKANDRIIELGVVYVSHRGEVTGSWTTLINPGRDVGPTSIHGITPTEVLDAPTFEQVAPLVLESIAGRTLVAHNAPFDLRFLDAELRRAGVPLGPQKMPAVCTLEWSHEFVRGPTRTLEACCQACGVPLRNAHSAAGDALATAGLLTHYLERSRYSPPWWDTVVQARNYRWPVYKGARPQVTLTGRGNRVARERSLTPAITLAPGDRVVFTGEMRRTRQEWEETATARGFTLGGVTKTTRLVVAADVNSLSRKAKMARSYGVPIVTESEFERLLLHY